MYVSMFAFVPVSVRTEFFQVHQDFGKLLESAELTDVTLTGLEDGGSIRAHRYAHTYIYIHMHIHTNVQSL